MSLSKLTFSSFVPLIGLLIVLLCNNWTWEIYSFNLLLIIILLAASASLYFSAIRKSNKLLCIFCLFLIPILFIQWKTTKNAGLDYMSETDWSLFATRRSELSAVAPNLEKYLGNKSEYIFYKFEQNLLRTMDLNLYFFGSHPRERSGIREFEKFSFLFLPLFIIGLLKLGATSPWQLGISSLIPLLALAIIGQDNPIGPFSLLPFLSVTIAVGMLHIIKKYNAV